VGEAGQLDAVLLLNHNQEVHEQKTNRYNQKSELHLSLTLMYQPLLMNFLRVLSFPDVLHAVAIDRLLITVEVIHKGFEFDQFPHHNFVVNPQKHLCDFIGNGVNAEHELDNEEPEYTQHDHEHACKPDVYIQDLAAVL
jgi:hypothetical protein